MDDIHTALAIALAKKLIDVESRIVALEGTIMETLNIKPEDFAAMQTKLALAARASIESAFLCQLSEDPQLAWLTAQFGSELLQ